MRNRQVISANTGGELTPPSLQALVELGYLLLELYAGRPVLFQKKRSRYFKMNTVQLTKRIEDASGVCSRRNVMARIRRPGVVLLVVNRQSGLLGRIQKWQLHDGEVLYPRHTVSAG